MKKTGYNALFTIIVLHNTEMHGERESRKDMWGGEVGGKRRKEEEEGGKESRETSMVIISLLNNKC